MMIKHGWMDLNFWGKAIKLHLHLDQKRGGGLALIYNDLMQCLERDKGELGILEICSLAAEIWQQTATCIGSTGGSHLSHTVVKPDSCLAWIFSQSFPGIT